MTDTISNKSAVGKIGGENLKGLPATFIALEKRLKDWESDIRLDGKNLQSAVVEQPSLLAYYDQLSVEAEAMLDYMEFMVKKVRAERMQFIKEHSSNEYTDTAIQKVIDGDKQYVKTYQIYLEVKELYEKSKAIVEAFKQRSYSLNNLVKIREAELENITIRME